MSKRMINNRFFESLDIADLSIRQRFLLMGMIAQADDQGRLPGDPRWIKAKVFPYDDIEIDDIKADLQAISSCGDTIIQYEADNRLLAQLRNWWKYQNLQWAAPSVYKPPDDWTDRIRQLQYKPIRWVMTLNWPSSEDKVSSGEETPNPLGNLLPNTSPISNTNTINSIDGGQGEEELGQRKIPPLPDYLTAPEFMNVWGEWRQHRQDEGKPITWATATRQYEQFRQWGIPRAIAAMEYSMGQGYTGLYEPKGQSPNGQSAEPAGFPAGREILQEIHNG